MAFDGITIANVVKELNDCLTGGRINKIAQPEKDELSLTIKNNRPVKMVKITEQGQNVFEEIYEKLKPHHQIVEEKIKNTDLGKVGGLLKELREILEESIEIDI